MKASEAAAAAEAVGTGAIVDECGYTRLAVSYASKDKLCDPYHANGGVGRRASPREDGRHYKTMKWRSARRGRRSVARS